MRDDGIDILRAIGLLMIILAHVSPPDIVFQMRNFDVPLMVLVSGMAFGLSYKRSEAYLAYLWKRFQRLAFPVWIFLTVYFTFQLVFDFLPSPAIVLSSYLFSGGIGFVWIIRVFLLVALVAPLLYNYHKATKSHTQYFTVLGICFICYESLRYISMPYLDNEIAGKVGQITHYIIPYSIIFAVGLRLTRLEKKKVGQLATGSFLIFSLIAGALWQSTGSFVPTQAFKYPPSIYYFSYAVFMSCVLWLYSARIESLMIQLQIKEKILFIAQNSIWMYLWHIPLLELARGNFIIKYMTVVLASYALTAIQVWLVKHVILKVMSSARAQKNVKLLFTG